MEYRHEMISFGEDLPVRFFIHQLGHSSRHWHSSLELLFVLSGQVTLYADGECYSLDRNDIILINSNSPHELTADNAVLAAVQIKLSLFENTQLNADELFFDCNSKRDPGNPGFLRLRRIMADFIRTYAQDQPGKLFSARALCYALLSELINSFRAEKNSTAGNQAEYQHERITRIIQFINEHYAEDISLHMLAEREYLSVPYLSKLFQRMMGLSFSAYLSQLRLAQAVTDLGSSTDAIELIARKNGFPNTQSFVRQFKEKYGMLPSQWRKSHPDTKKKSAGEAGFNEYIILDTNDYLKNFSELIAETDASPVAPPMELPDIVSHDTADAAAEGKTLLARWKLLTSVASAHDLLQEDVQRMLAQLQRDVGFSYIKFHGILSDNMHVCMRMPDGSLRFSFVYVDKALDFLLSVGLKPLIQLSFMPEALAAEPSRTIFDSDMINSLPRETDEWCRLVDAFLHHLILRYSRETVVRWPMTIWNEPDTPDSMFGFTSPESFLPFYQATFETIRSILPEARIGAPSSYFDKESSIIWNTLFYDWCRTHGCMPDFPLYHFYGMVLAPEDPATLDSGRTLHRLQLTTDEDLMSKSIDAMLSMTRKEYGDQVPVYLTEWNFSPSHREPLGDTCFRSCYLVKNILENYDRLNCMGYWTLTDLLEERQVPPDIFHGGLGLFTYNGIKKPVYYAMWLLNKLGDELVGSGDGWFLTRKGRDYQLMLYHYRHYSDLYAACETFDVTPTNRYSPFDPYQRRDFELRIMGIASGTWNATEYTVNRQSGSAFDKWVEMGARSIDSAEEVELLRCLSQPMINKYLLSATDRSLTISAILEPLEVKLILLKQG